MWFNTNSTKPLVTTRNHPEPPGTTQNHSEPPGTTLEHASKVHEQDAHHRNPQNHHTGTSASSDAVGKRKLLRDVWTSQYLVHSNICLGYTKFNAFLYMVTGYLFLGPYGFTWVGALSQHNCALAYYQSRLHLFWPYLICCCQWELGPRHVRWARPH